MAPPGTYPIQTAEADLQLATLGPPWPPPPFGPDEWIRRFATLPLLHQPGEQWMYNTGAQVLGILLERAGGQPLEALLRDRLFGPLGMVDTGFSVPPDRLGRFTTAYAPDPKPGVTEVINVLDPIEGSWWGRPPALPNAAGWMVSTIDDFWAFARMLVDRGVHDGERILSEASIELMVTRPADRCAASGVDALPRCAQQLGPRPVGAGRGGRPRRHPPRHRMGRWHGHHLAQRPGPRSHRDPVHAAGHDLTRASGGVRRLLGVGVRRHRGLILDSDRGRAPVG